MRRAEVGTGTTEGVAPPYEQDGTGVIALTAVRRHTAGSRRTDGAEHLHAELSGSSPLGAFVVREGRVHWRPAVDVTRVVVTAQLVTGAVLVARQLARRPSGAKAAVVMGPGGWISMRGGSMAVRPARRGWRRLPERQPAARAARRPPWARLLAAVPLRHLAG